MVSNQIGNALVHAQLQADLRASEEQYRALVENSDDAIYIADTSGRPRFANSAFPRIFGYALYEVARTGLLEYVHSEDMATVRRALSVLLGVNPSTISNTGFIARTGCGLICSAAAVYFRVKVDA